MINFYDEHHSLCTPVLPLTHQKIALHLHPLSNRVRFIGNCFWLLEGIKQRDIKTSILARSIVQPAWITLLYTLEYNT